MWYCYKNAAIGVRLTLHWLLSHCDLGRVNASLLASAFVCRIEILILTSQRPHLHHVYTWYAVCMPKSLKLRSVNS